MLRNVFQGSVTIKVSYGSLKKASGFLISLYQKSFICIISNIWSTADLPLLSPLPPGHLLPKEIVDYILTSIVLQVVSAVNCARRGWINVDIDTIACEACRARLFFSTPASWNQQQGSSLFICLSFIILQLYLYLVYRFLN